MSFQEFNPTLRIKDTAPASSAEPIYHTKYFIKEGDLLHSIDLNKILFFFAQNKTTYAQLIDKKIALDSSLRFLTERLKPYFIRVHKGFLVNQAHILQINLKESLLYCHIHELPIGSQYKKNLLDGLPTLK